MPTQNVTWLGSSGGLVTSEGQAAVATRGTAPTVSGGKLAFTDAASTSPFITWDVGTGEQRAQATVSPFGGDSLYFRVVDAGNWWRVRVRRQQVQTTTQVYVPPETRTEYEWRWTYSRPSLVGVPLHTHNQDGGLKSTTPSDPYYGWSTSKSTPPSSYVSSVTHDHLVPNAFAETHTHNTSSGPSLTGNQRTITVRAGYYQTQTSTTTYRWLHVERSVGGTLTELRALQYGEGQAITPVVVEAAGTIIRLWHSGMTEPATTVDDATHSTATRLGLGLGGPSDGFGTNLTSLTAVPLIYSPQRPTILAPPNGATVDFTTLPSWQAQYNNQNLADRPTHRRVRRKVGANPYEYEQANGTFSTAETDIALPAGTGSTVTWTPPANVWVNGTTYAWSVNFRGEQSGQWGTYADDVLVTGNSAPTLSISTPIGVQTGNRPRVVLLYADAQNDAPTDVHVKVFLASQTTATGFNPDTATAAWDSTRLPASHPSLTVEDLTGGNYRISVTVGNRLEPNNTEFVTYARAWQSGGLATRWATQPFRIAVLPPAAPSLTGYYDVESGATRLIGASQDNLLSADAASHEGPQLAWRPVSNASLGLTSDGPQHGLQALVVTALGAGDMTVETVEAVDVRVDLPLTGMTSTQHLGNARVVVEAFVVYDEEGREIGTFNVADGWQETEGQEPETPVALPGRLLVSAHPDRREAQPLSGQALTNPAFVFVEDPNPQSTIAQVAFSINGVARPTETSAPWDLMGGSETSATPWDTSSLAAGTYTITAVVTPLVGNAYTLSGALVKEAQLAALRVSPNSTLTPAAALTGQEMDGTVHVFLSGGDVSSVSWIVDGVSAGTDSTSPFVLPLDMTAVPAGATRRVEAAVTPPVGAVYTLAGSLTRGAQVQPGDEGYYNIGGGQVVGTGGKTYAPTPAGLVRGGTNHTVPAAIADPLIAAGRPEFATGQFFSGGRGIIEITATGRKRLVLSMLEDTFGAAGQRVFTAYAGTSNSFYSTLHNLDMYATAGRGVPLSREIVVDGPAVIELRSSADNPYLSSIAVLNGAGLPLTPVNQVILPPQIMVSQNADRSNAVPLNGQAFTGSIYVFVTGDSLESVTFSLDGTARPTDTTAPFDLVGGTATQAQPLDVNALSSGQHTVSAAVRKTDGSTAPLSATFSKAQAPVAGIRTTSKDPVRRAFDVTDTMGVAGHLTYPAYSDYNAVLGAMNYLGIKHFRDGWGNNREPIAAFVRTSFRSHGIKLCLTHDYRDWPAGYTAEMMKNEHKARGILPDIDVAEGPNERDLVGDYQVYRTVASQMGPAYKNDPEAAHILLATGSLADTVAESKYRQVGDLSAFVSAATFHDYPGNARMMTDTILDYKGRNGRHMIPTPADQLLTTISTEHGFGTGTSGDDGKRMPDSHSYGRPAQLLRIYLECVRGRASGPYATDQVRTYLYELKDQGGSTNVEAQFGLFEEDWRPHPAATAIRNMTTLLSDPSPNRASFAPQPMNFTLSGADSARRHLLMQKTDGSYWLAVWRQVVTWNGSTMTGPHQLDSTLSVPTGWRMSRYMPTVDQTVKQTGTTSMVVPVSADVNIVEIRPA